MFNFKGVMPGVEIQNCIEGVQVQEDTVNRIRDVDDCATVLPRRTAVLVDGGNAPFSVRNVRDICELADNNRRKLKVSGSVGKSTFNVYLSDVHADPISRLKKCELECSAEVAHNGL
jgi:hypothetical protein